VSDGIRSVIYVILYTQRDGERQIDSCTYFRNVSIFVPVLRLLFTKNHFWRIILRLTTLWQIEGASINPLPVPSSEWVQWLHCEYRDDYRSGRNNFRRYIEPPHQSIHLPNPYNYDMIMHRRWQLSSLLLMQRSWLTLTYCVVKRCALKAYGEYRWSSKYSYPGTG
jgi:hypothetical protein